MAVSRSKRFPQLSRYFFRKLKVGDTGTIADSSMPNGRIPVRVQGIGVNDLMVDKLFGETVSSMYGFSEQVLLRGFRLSKRALEKEKRPFDFAMKAWSRYSRARLAVIRDFMDKAGMKLLWLHNYRGIITAGAELSSDTEHWYEIGTRTKKSQIKIVVDKHELVPPCPF